MSGVGPILAALVFGVAIGLLNNTLSSWVRALAGRPGFPPDQGETDEGADRPAPGLRGGWPTLFVAQFILRLILSVASLYIVFYFTGGASAPILANLAGLLGTRYALLWRLTRDGSGEAA